MILIGVTGTVGSGKTTVSAMLRKEGQEVIDLDKIAKEIARQERIISDIRNAFGGSYVIDGEIDTERVGRLVFHNKEAREVMRQPSHWQDQTPPSASTVMPSGTPWPSGTAAKRWRGPTLPVTRSIS